MSLKEETEVPHISVKESVVLNEPQAIDLNLASANNLTTEKWKI